MFSWDTNINVKGENKKNFNRDYMRVIYMYIFNFPISPVQAPV